MTTGQLVFDSGAGLLVLTVLLAVFFAVKKPKYIPENAAHTPVGPQQTEPLRNGYPTDPVTRRRTGASAAAAPTEVQTAAATELMMDEQAGNAGATELLPDEPPKNDSATELL